MKGYVTFEINENEGKDQINIVAQVHLEEVNLYGKAQLLGAMFQALQLEDTEEIAMLTALAAITGKSAKTQRINQEQLTVEDPKDE